MWLRPPLCTPPLRMATRTRPSCASSFAAMLEPESAYAPGERTPVPFPG